MFFFCFVHRVKYIKVCPLCLKIFPFNKSFYFFACLYQLNTEFAGFTTDSWVWDSPVSGTWVCDSPVSGSWVCEFSFSATNMISLFFNTDPFLMLVSVDISLYDFDEICLAFVLHWHWYWHLFRSSSRVTRSFASTSLVAQNNNFFTQQWNCIIVYEWSCKRSAFKILQSKFPWQQQ